MATYRTNEFKSGLKILIDGNPCSIVSNESIKPGKGQAFNRVKLRNLLNNRVIEKTFKSGESVEAADVIEREMQFLYEDKDQLFFMDPESFEQIEMSQARIGEAKNWLKEQALCQITLWNNEAISLVLPNFVVLKVIGSDPGLKGDTVSGGSKPVTLETGGSIRVPLFIKEHDMIKIDTRKGEYVSRVNE